MSVVKRNWHMFVAVLLAVTMVALVGCSRSIVDSTQAADQPHVLSRMAPPSSGASGSPVNLYAEQVISAVLGGQLRALDVVLTVPPGAVHSDTLFSIFIPDDEIFYNEFGTDGLVFDVPVTVTMSYRNADLSGVDESTIRIGYWNITTGKWHDMTCTVDYVNKTVTAQLTHFSAYGLISD